MFRQITMDELKDLALDAYGQIEKAYYHWTGVKGGKHFTDYHINIDRAGTMWKMCIRDRTNVRCEWCAVSCSAYCIIST